DARRQKRQMQRAGAAVHRDRVRHPAPGCKFLLERGDLAAQHIFAGGENREHRGVQLAPDARILRSEIEKRDHATCLAGSSSMTRPRWASDSVAASRMRTTRSPA